MNLSIRLILILLLSFVVPCVSAGKAKKDVLKGLRLSGVDESKNDVRALKTELLVERSEKRAISQLKLLVKKYRGTQMESTLLFRLAELYMRKAKVDRFFEIHRNSETVVSLAPRKVKSASSKKLVIRAIKIYDRIERRFPKFENIDQVVFNNAFARQGIGQVKEAEKRYWKLISEYENSPLVPDGHLAIGEISFSQQRFKFALDHFNAIKRYPESRVYPYGLYKSAWTHYNLSQAKKGMDELEKVVEFGKYVESKGIDSKLDLRKEALIDMTIFYGDVYLAKDAVSYFLKQAGPKEIGRVIANLSRLYERHSRHKDRFSVLNQYIKGMPKGPEVAEFQRDLVLNFEAMKDRKSAVSELEKLYSLCEGGWAKSQPDPKLASEECYNYSNLISIKLAQKWLRIWRKNKSYPLFADSSEKAFAIYLRRNKAGKQINKARFAYAELLFQRKKFRRASFEYTLVSENSKDKILVHDSSYAAIVGLEKAVKDKWNRKDEKAFLKLSQSYLKKNSKGKFILDVEFKMALMDYEKERYDSAAKVFRKLGKTYSHKKKGKRAQDLYLDILNLRKITRL